MRTHLSTIAILSTVVLAAGCGSSGISSTTETTGLVPSSGDGAGQPHSRRLCTPSSTATAPATGLIADFSSASDGQLPGKLITYSDPKLVDQGSLSYATTGGSLNIKIGAPAISRPQFLGTMILFDGCIDASAFTGVQFTISGSFSGCSLVYATGDVEHEDATRASTFASGPTGAFAPQHRLSADDLGSTPRTIKLRFLGTDIQGNPATPIDPAKLIFAVWQFIVPIAADDGSATPPCAANVTIDDIKFYR
jgi:hypothetical protein